MCFELDSEPPIPAISGAAISHDDLALEAADGNRFAAFRAMPDGPAATGVVILPDVRGLYRFYEELALRFAERGYVAVAIDYFGRTAGVAKRGDDFEYMPHVQQTKPGLVQADVGAAVRHLRALGCTSDLHRRLLLRRPQLVARRCVRPRAERGGRLLRAPRRAERRARPDAARGEIEAPILALQAGDDQNITVRGQRAVRRGADRRPGVEHEIVVYDGAPHSFFDRKQEEFADASEDAWRRTLAFLERQASKPGR